MMNHFDNFADTEDGFAFKGFVHIGFCPIDYMNDIVVGQVAEDTDLLAALEQWDG